MAEEIIERTPSDACLLCGEAPGVLGIFVPGEPSAWGISAGKAFRYCLCSKCHQRSDKMERVEKIIRHELAGGGVTYGK